MLSILSAIQESILLFVGTGPECSALLGKKTFKNTCKKCGFEVDFISFLGCLMFLL